LLTATLIKNIQGDNAFYPELNHNILQMKNTLMSYSVRRLDLLVEALARNYLKRVKKHGTVQVTDISAARGLYCSLVSSARASENDQKEIYKNCNPFVFI